MKLALSQPKVGERLIALEEKNNTTWISWQLQKVSQTSSWQEEFVDFTTCSPQSCKETRRMRRTVSITGMTGDVTSQQPLTPSVGEDQHDFRKAKQSGNTAAEACLQLDGGGVYERRILGVM